MKTPYPARLHVLLARESPMALVIRRGPSKVTCTIGWDRRDDTFSVGQWLKGRVYERRSDIAPDGKHWVYFAMDGHWDGEANGSWTAIARVPYLKALGLFAKGDCWHGGGLFVSPTSVWVNGKSCHRCLTHPREVRTSSRQPFGTLVSGECPGVYYPRLLRDGWQRLPVERPSLLSRVRDACEAISGSVPPVQETNVFTKDAPAGWSLRKIAHATIDHPIGKGCYYDEHQLRHERTGQSIDLPDWEWADVDRDRLVYAEKGCLYAATLTRDGLGEPRLLRDFNGMVFEPIAAPY